MNAFSGVLLQQPEYIRSARARGLVVFCWGDENANPDTIRYLKSQGCDAVVYDCVDRYCEKEPKQSVFMLEARQAGDLAGSGGSRPSAEDASGATARKGRR